MAMNIFRRMGDTSHQLAIIILILHLRRARNARGISIKTQELRLMVFCARYTDLFTTFYSYYNSIVKVCYITATVGILVMCKTNPIRRVYNHEQDPFPHWKFAVLPCAIIALIFHLISGEGAYRGLIGNIQQTLWVFSIVLESIAILPQLVTLRKYRLVENLTGKFIFFLGIYRFLYGLNWVYRSYHEPGYRHKWVPYVGGFIQTLLYADFFYQYMRITCECCGNRGRAREEEDDDEYDDTNLIFEVARNTVGEHEMDQAVLSPLLDNGEDSDDGTARLRSRPVVIIEP